MSEEGRFTVYIHGLLLVVLSLAGLMLLPLSLPDITLTAWPSSAPYTTVVSSHLRYPRLILTITSTSRRLDILTEGYKVQIQGKNKNTLSGNISPKSFTNPPQKLNSFRAISLKG